MIKQLLIRFIAKISLKAVSIKPSKLFCFYVFILFALSCFIYPAIYQGKNIDERHFSAKIRMDGAENVYEVDVVFVGKAANMAFPAGIVLPIEAGDNYLMTLYLLDSNIRNPKRIKLKQVSPPMIVDDTEPEDWPATAYWYMELDLE